MYKYNIGEVVETKTDCRIHSCPERGTIIHCTKNRITKFSIINVQNAQGYNWYQFRINGNWHREDGLIGENKGIFYEIY